MDLIVRICAVLFGGTGYSSKVVHEAGVGFVRDNRIPLFINSIIGASS